MEVHRHNQSNLLRQKARGECKYCGTPVEWFDRYDTKRIPLSPEVPASRIPEQYQWHVSKGVAYPGVDPRAPQYCRVPHPVMCPALEHEDLPGELADVVARLAVRLRTRIERDGFIPAIPPAADDGVGDDDAEQPLRRPGVPERVRHTVHYAGSLRLGPGPLEEVQCTARRESGERCPNAVFVAGEGAWELFDLPHLPGRSGQMILSTTNGKMWVWSLTTVDFPAAARWLRQRCPAHQDSAAAAACPPEWEDFHPLRHSDFIVARKPEGYEPGPDRDGPTIHDGPRKLRRCAEEGCHNTTAAPVPEGWLCWRCSKLVKRRTATHRRWQQRPGPQQP